MKPIIKKFKHGKEKSKPIIQGKEKINSSKKTKKIYFVLMFVKKTNQILIIVVKLVKAHN